MVKALRQAVFDTSVTKIDGKPTAIFCTAEFCEVLISVVGMFMKGAPHCRTLQGMRTMTEAVGRNTLAALKTARKVLDDRGAGILGGDRVVIN